MAVFKVSINKEPSQHYRIKSVEDKSETERLIVFEKGMETLSFGDLLMSGKMMDDGDDDTAMEVIKIENDKVTLRMIQGTVDNCRKVEPGELFFKVGTFKLEEDGSNKNISQNKIPR